MLSETEQLREVGLICGRGLWGQLTDRLVSQDLKILEEDVERSLAREESILAGENPPSPSLDDVQALQRSYKDLKAKYEVRRSD